MTCATRMRLGYVRLLLTAAVLGSWAMAGLDFFYVHDRLLLGVAWVLTAGGGTLNWLVIVRNGWRMPVATSVPPACACHAQMRPETPLRWLGDRFPIRGRIVSVGDLLTFAAGAPWLAFVLANLLK